MATVREFAEDDLPGVVALFQRVFPRHGWDSAADCLGYFREIFFDNPWRDPEIPSRVAQHEGRIVAFSGVLARPMLFGGQPIRVAVSCIFMVDPQLRHSLVAVQLAKALFSGPQQLTLADGATEQARFMWQGLGGQQPLAYNLHWLRLLRPARHLLTQLRECRMLPRPVAFALLPFARLTDDLFARLTPNRFLRQACALTEVAANPVTIATDLPQLLGDGILRPQYQAGALAWIFRHSATRKGHGSLRSHRLLDAQRRPVGWYLYYLRRGGVCEVLQLVASAQAYGQVLQRLLADAWQQGATAVRGRVDPDRASMLSRQHCWLRCDGPALLIHSHHPAITAAVLRGDAFLSRLDGEWWLRFVSG